MMLLSFTPTVSIVVKSAIVDFVSIGLYKTAGFITGYVMYYYTNCASLK